jgi:CheY-like chemotaxis protein
MDLQLPVKDAFSLVLVKSQRASLQLVTITANNDDDPDAKALAHGYGVSVLLEKMKLYNQLIPTIKQFSAEGNFSGDEQPRATSAFCRHKSTVTSDKSFG